MRKTKKSALYDFFNSSDVNLPSNFINVVDGGYLLHRVVWQQQETYAEVIQKYVKYVEKYYQPHSVIDCL